MSHDLQTLWWLIKLAVLYTGAAHLVLFISGVLWSTIRYNRLRHRIGQDRASEESATVDEAMRSATCMLSAASVGIIVGMCCLFVIVIVLR